jgi:hypothetical protein
MISSLIRRNGVCLVVVSNNRSSHRVVNHRQGVIKANEVNRYENNVSKHNNGLPMTHFSQKRVHVVSNLSNSYLQIVL